MESPLISKELITDTKTLFDAIRNIGICAALTLGLPFIEQSIPVAFGGNWLKAIAVYCTIGVIIGLYLCNLAWLFSSLTAKQSSKHFHAVSSTIVILLITLSICSTAFQQVWGQLFHYG